MTGAATGETEPAPAERAPWLAWVVAFALLSGLIQLLIPSFFDGDTGYHLAVARLTSEHGVLHAFPWTPFSWLAEHYADKELLFHWLLVPLAGVDPIWASRVAGTVLGTALLVTIYTLLRAEGVANAGLWTLAPLAVSSAFVVRFAMVRPHLLSVPLTLVLTWAAVRQRRVLLALAGFLFPLCYTAWHLPLVLIGLVEVARWMSKKRIDWRMPAVLLPALALGILVHPNFPESAQLFWIQNSKILFGTAWSGTAGVDLGGEFKPFSPTGLLRYVLLSGCLASAAAWLGFRSRDRDLAPLAFAIVAVAFLLLTFRTQRFIEYAAPFAAFAAAIAFARQASDCAPERAGRVVSRQIAALVVVIGLVFTAAFGRRPIESLRGRHSPFPPQIAQLLSDIIPEGAQVVTCGWRLTGEMMLALPKRRFMVALDPVFFAVGDPERYQVWFETIHSPPPRPAELLRDTFNASYVLCAERERWRSLHRALAEDPAAVLRGDIGPWRVYQLRPPEFDAAALTRR
jgi:hypothetical protein